VTVSVDCLDVAIPNNVGPRAPLAPSPAGADPEFGKGGCTLLKRLKTKKQYHYEVKV